MRSSPFCPASFPVWPTICFPANRWPSLAALDLYSFSNKFVTIFASKLNKTFMWLRRSNWYFVENVCDGNEAKQRWSYNRDDYHIKSYQIFTFWQVFVIGLRFVSILGGHVDGINIARYGCVWFILSRLLHYSVYRWVSCMPWVMSGSWALLELGIFIGECTMG